MHSPAPRSPFAALFALELRRARKPLLQVVVGSAVLLPPLHYGGIVESSTVTFLLLVATLLPALACPGHALRDKLDGSLEFLAKLPATPTILALGRFAAAGALSAVGAVYGALATAMNLAPLLNASAVRIFLVSYPVALLVLVTAACVATAIWIRFKLSQLGLLGMLLPFLGVIAVGWLVELAFDDPLQAFLDIVASQAGRWILALSAFAACLATLAASFAIARAALRDYEPELDAIDA